MTDLVPYTPLDNLLEKLQSEGRMTDAEDGIDIWLTQKEMADYFGITKQAVSLHVGNFEKADIDGYRASVKELLTVTNDGKNRKVEYYNMDVILWVGYRAQNTPATMALRRKVASILRGYFASKVLQLADEKEQLLLANAELDTDLSNAHREIRVLSAQINDEIVYDPDYYHNPMED